jgi:hypothetical protein
MFVKKLQENVHLEKDKSVCVKLLTTGARIVNIKLILPHTGTMQNTRLFVQKTPFLYRIKSLFCLQLFPSSLLFCDFGFAFSVAFSIEKRAVVAFP